MQCMLQTHAKLINIRTWQEGGFNSIGLAHVKVHAGLYTPVLKCAGQTLLANTF